MRENDNLKVLFVSVEVAPFAKTGGLADVAGSLPKSLLSMGYDVRVAMPRYQQIETNMKYVTDFPVDMGGRQSTCIVREGEIGFKSDGKDMSVPIYFLDNYHYFNRGGIYCYFDDADRFAFFCKAALEMLPKIDFKPDIIHCNDWHTGPMCMFLNEKYKTYPFYKNIKTMFTIHNLEYQGNFSRDVMGIMGMPDEVFVPEKVEFYGMFSFMKAGLVYSDIITTVSETYAKEIQTERYGEKLEGLLKNRSKDLYGIVNGIDYDVFNPETDPRIYKNYTVDTFKLKAENKYALQKEMGLPKKDVPVIGLISRLTGQKGLNLIMDEIDEMMKEDIQFILLGAGDEYYETGFKKIQEKYPDKVGVFIGFNAPLAQRIYAGSDMFLMPSRFEPCGLGQLFSLRYGTIPIVRSTGGLAETVIDIDKDKKNGNGFSYQDFTSKDMMDTIKRAIKFYNEKPLEWEDMVKRAMISDYSWNSSASKYSDLYLKLVKKKK
ncbi:MAG TPA: glycogen synthase GlgA [Clostridium sp.]|nr:starch synthase [Clostridium sp. Bc-iso-3]HHV28714.1 glycogen synthase GlgA [Clostridium sp.]